MDMKQQPDAPKFVHEAFERVVKEIADRLRSLADEVEREGSVHQNSVGVPKYGWTASQVVHSIVWGTANLRLSLLVQKGAEADRFTLDPDLSDLLDRD